MSMDESNYGARSKKTLGELGGPGSDVPSKIDNDADTSTLGGLLDGEDAKVDRANANLQSRLNEVASLPDNFAGGFDTQNADTAAEQE